MSKFFKFYNYPEIRDRFNINIAGYGDNYSLIKNRFQENENIKFMGWLNQKQLAKLYAISSYGLVTYDSRIDFMNNITNKVSEYLGYNLPIITTLKGESFKILKSKDCALYCDLNNKKKFEEIFLKLIHYKSALKNNQNPRKLFLKYFDNEKNNLIFFNIINNYLNEIPQKKI